MASACPISGGRTVGELLWVSDMSSDNAITFWLCQGEVFVNYV